MSRTSIIAACILSGQPQFLNMIPIIGFTNVFLFVNGLYSYISIIPAYNDKCCRSILQWLARSQFSMRKTRNQSIRFHYYQIRIWQKSLKSNLFIQMIINNKIAAMCACVFYSRQDKMNLSNTLFIFMMICSVLSANLVYYQIAKLPTYNTNCIRNLLRWLARLQWSTKFEWKGKRKIFIYKIQQIQWRHSLKSNLFIQTLTNNKFGFTCGHLFFITKYKFIELILLNIPLILMLYKHVYRSTILIN
uniref:Uncharacterized protein LOC113788523 n=1 Tax=Dermatophagoides pteronyssinus TaxID=6956 RepID=A0A6P6XLY6_DERPT|nr:uncharacterized protein LOC113788523 [Dermatophagoides pteronyssinus]